MHYDEQHPHGASTAYIGMGRSDPLLRGIEDIDNDRQANRIMARITEAAGGPLDSKLERDVRVIIYGWLAYTFELCRQRIVDPSIDAGYVADSLRAFPARRRRTHPRHPHPGVISRTSARGAHPRIHHVATAPQISSPVTPSGAPPGAGDSGLPGIGRVELDPDHSAQVAPRRA